MSPMAIDPEDHKVVNTTLNYWLDPAKGGHTEYRPGTASYFDRKFDSRPTKIHDIRGREDQFDLSTNGFQHVKHVSAEKDFIDDEQVKRVVYPEIGELLKKVTGATYVHTWAHVTRRSSREKTEAEVRAAKLDPSAPVTKVTPANHVHIDQSEEGAPQILADNLPRDVAERLAKSRWGIINVWRAIKPVSKDPLAVCDYRTVRQEDLKPIVSYPPGKDSPSPYKVQSAGKSFELYYAAYNPDQTWYYVDTMKPDEVLMIKCYDSLKDGKTARRCPHTAFSNPDTANESTRESIEIRNLVFFEDQPL